MSNRFSADGTCSIDWRFAGSRTWYQIVATASQSLPSVIADNIERTQSDLGDAGMYPIFLIDNFPPLALSVLSLEEGDLLAGHKDIAVNHQRTTIHLHVGKQHLLVRIDRSGFVETLALSSNSADGSFTFTLSDTRGIIICPLYTRQLDFVCGSQLSGTRVSDHARSQYLVDLHRSIAHDNLPSAEKIALDFFRNEINPSYQVPYVLDSGPSLNTTVSTLAEARITPLLQAIQLAIPEIADPISYTIEYPRTPHGIPRIASDQPFTEKTQQDRPSRMAALLIGLACFDLPGHGTYHPVAKQALLSVDDDCPRGLRFDVDVATCPSAHDRLAAFTQVAEFWAQERQRGDLQHRAMIVRPLDSDLRSNIEALDRLLLT